MPTPPLPLLEPVIMLDWSVCILNISVIPMTSKSNVSLVVLSNNVLKLSQFEAHNKCRKLINVLPVGCHISKLMWV